MNHLLKNLDYLGGGGGGGGGGLGMRVESEMSQLEKI